MKIIFIIALIVLCTITLVHSEYYTALVKGNVTCHNKKFDRVHGSIRGKVDVCPEPIFLDSFNFTQAGTFYFEVTVNGRIFGDNLDGKITLNFKHECDALQQKHEQIEFVPKSFFDKGKSSQKFNDIGTIELTNKFKPFTEKPFGRRI